MLKRLRVLWMEPEPGGPPEGRAEARTRTLILTGLAIVGPLVLLSVYSRAQFMALTDSNALDFAQLGRNIIQGHGFTTNWLRPFVLKPRYGLLHQPEVVNGPLYPLLLGIVFGLKGHASDSGVEQLSALFYLLTIPVLYTLLNRLFGRIIALLGAVVYTVDGTMLSLAISGRDATLYVFLTTWLLLVIYNLGAHVRDHAGDRAAPLPRNLILLAGFLTGLLYLTDPVLLCLAPVVIATIIVLGRGNLTRTCGWLIPPFAVPAVWLMVNFARAGANPLFGARAAAVWMGTRAYPGDIGFRMAPPEIVPGLALIRGVVEKLLIQFGAVLHSASALPGAWVLIFLVPSLFFPYTDPVAVLLRRTALWLMLAALIGTLFFGAGDLFLCVVPVLLGFALAFLFHLARQAQLPRAGATATVSLLGVAVIYPLLGSLISGQAQDRRPEVRVARSLRRLTRTTDVILTDRPDIVAWYGNRTALWLPALDNRLGAIMRVTGSRRGQVRWLLLTPAVQSYPDMANSFEWQQAYQWFTAANQAWAQATGSGATPPAAPVLDPTPQTISQYPLFDTLRGAVWVAPPNRASASVALARMGPPAARAAAPGGAGP